MCELYVIFVSYKSSHGRAGGGGGVEKYGFDSWPNMENLDKGCAIF